MSDHSGRYCTEDGCLKPHKAMGLCRLHYMRARRALASEARKALPPKERKPRARKTRKPPPEVEALCSWPDRHPAAPGGQRLVRYLCPSCGREHLVSWNPFDEHPGEKQATCVKGAHGAITNPEVLVLAPPVEQQLDREPPRSVVLGDPTQRNQWTDA